MMDNFTDVYLPPTVFSVISNRWQGDSEGSGHYSIHLRWSKVRNRLCFWYGTIQLAFTVIMMQDSPFITLCLGSIEMDRVISEPCYKGMIL